MIVSARYFIVCFPYEFTLLSNIDEHVPTMLTVCFPYEFTLLSNSGVPSITQRKFVFPTNLHCSQTNGIGSRFFNSLFSLRIYTALKLVGLLFDEDASLFSLRIYTALKQKFIVSHKLTPFVFPTNLHCSQT